VPLCSVAELARHYPRPGDTRASPRALLAAERRALVTALALVQQARPRDSLLAGRIVWLGDGDAASRFPLLLRPGVVTAAELGSRQPSVLVGPAERLLAVGDALRSWPGLVGVISIRSDHREAGPALRDALGERRAVVELLQLPGGPIAVEDARLGGLRLLPEHGCFFELVAEAGALQPERLTPEEARVGEVYELALSSAAGLWACRTGLHLMFDPKGRPRAVAPPAAAPVRSDPPAAAPAPHRPTAGTPAARPGTPSHTPWSAPADRGS
jgi:hypothetical protein